MLAPFGTPAAPSPSSGSVSNAEDIAAVPGGNSTMSNALRPHRTRVDPSVPLAVRHGGRSSVRAVSASSRPRNEGRRGVVGNMTTEPYIGEIVGTATLVL